MKFDCVGSFETYLDVWKLRIGKWFLIYFSIFNKSKSTISYFLFTFFFVGDEWDTSVELSLPFIKDSVTLWDLLGVDFPDFSLRSVSLSIVSSTDFDFGFFENNDRNI